MTEAQTTATRFCARIIGPQMLIICVGATALLIGWLTFVGWFAKA